MEDKDRKNINRNKEGQQQAGISGDFQTARKECLDTDEHTERTDKPAVLALVQSGDLKLESIKLSDMRVYEYGDAAVVTGTGEQVGNFKGQPVTAKLIFTDTFVRKNGKWRAVASHRSAI